MEELDFDSLVDMDADLTACEVNVEVTEAVHKIASEKRMTKTTLANIKGFFINDASERFPENVFYA